MSASIFRGSDWLRLHRYRYAYYRLVEKVDAEIGVLLDGLRVRRQVFFPVSDN
jgi:hypothetical protein